MTSTETTGHAARLDSITGLRWWAAFVVFGYHMLVFAPLPAIAASFLQFGYFGVTFFFVLSGFVLTWSMRSGIPKSTFYWRRFARIYTLHFVTLLIAIPVFYSFDPDPAQWWVKPFSVGILLLSFFLLQGWSRDPTILFSGNPAAWTLTIEAFFYAVHPFVAMVITRFSRRAAIIAAAGVVAFAVVCQVVIQIDPQSWFALLPWPILRLNEFVLGMCLAWAFRQGWRPRLHPIVPTIGIAGYFAAIVASEGFEPFRPLYVVVSPYNSEVVTVLCALLIIAAASRELRGRRDWMTSRPLVMLGEWSFAFYLIHATIVYTFLTVLGAQPARWANLGWYAIVLILAVAASGILHRFIEKPFEARLRRWQQDKVRARHERQAAAEAG